MVSYTMVCDSLLGSVPGRGHAHFCTLSTDVAKACRRCAAVRGSFTEFMFFALFIYVCTIVYVFLLSSDFENFDFMNVSRAGVVLFGFRAFSIQVAGLSNYGPQSTC